MSTNEICKCGHPASDHRMTVTDHPKFPVSREACQMCWCDWEYLGEWDDVCWAFQPRQEDTSTGRGLADLVSRGVADISTRMDTRPNEIDMQAATAVTAAMLKDTTTAINVREFIALLRSMYPDGYAPMSGGCWKMWKLLKHVYPSAVGWYNGDHIVTEIGGRYWDVDGEVADVRGYLTFEEYGGEEWVREQFEG